MHTYIDTRIFDKNGIKCLIYTIFNVFYSLDNILWASYKYEAILLLQDFIIFCCTDDPKYVLSVS